MNVRNIAIAVLLVNTALFVTGCTSKQDMTQFLYTQANQVANSSPEVDTEDRIRHDNLSFIADMHADTANWFMAGEHEKILGELAGNGERIARKTGHVDLVRLIEGNVALQVFALVSGASADHQPSKEFKVCIEDGKSQKCEEVTVPRAAFQRTPGSPYFTGPEGLRSYVRDYPLIPRPPIQYMRFLQNYPCKFWFEKKADADWPKGVGNWPCYARNKLTYINGEQRCSTWDSDPDHDLYLAWAEQFAKNIVFAADRSQEEKNKLVVIRSKSDLKSFLVKRNKGKKKGEKKGMAAAMLSIEGLYMQDILDSPVIDKKINTLFRRLFNSGYRMIAFSHFQDSEFGGSSTGMGDLSPASPYGPDDWRENREWDKKPRGRKIGISKAGSKFLDLMLKHGVIPDVAHAAPSLLSAIVDRANRAKKPVVCSHTGFKLFTNQDERNLSKKDIVEIASTGGVIGVGYAKNFVGGEKPIDFARAVRYAVDVIDAAQVRKHKNPKGTIIKGVETVALGSDYDGGIKAIVDTAHLNAITRALTCAYHPVLQRNCLEDNFSEKELTLIMGENTRRVMLEHLPENDRLLN